MEIQEYIERLQERTLTPKSIPLKFKTAIVGFLKGEGLTCPSIGKEIGMPLNTVYWHLRKFEAAQGEIVKQLAGRMIGRLYYKAEHLYEKAMRAGELDTAWKIETGFFDRLCKVGLVESFADYEPPKRDYTRRDPKIIEAEFTQGVTLLERVKLRAANATEGNGTDSDSDGRRTGDTQSGNGKPEDPTSK